MTSKKRSLVSIKQIKTGLSFILLITFVIACDTNKESASIAPFKEVLVIKELKGSIKKYDAYLTWDIPEGKDSPEDMIKGFIIFGAKVPEKGVKVEDECKYEPFDFILASHKPSRTYEYISKNAIRDDGVYLYKVVVMDKNNRTGKDSNVVSLQRGKDN